MKTINLNEETWKKLNQLKYNFGCNSIEEVIKRLLKILTKFKLGEEFKEFGKGEEE